MSTILLKPQSTHFYLLIQFHTYPANRYVHSVNYTVSPFIVHCLDLKSKTNKASKNKYISHATKNFHISWIQYTPSIYEIMYSTSQVPLLHARNNFNNSMNKELCPV